MACLNVCMNLQFLGRQRRPYIVFRNRFLYGFMFVYIYTSRGSPPSARPSTSCTGVWLAITMLQYYICLGIVLTVILVLGLGLGFGIILYFVIGT